MATTGLTSWQRCCKTIANLATKECSNYSSSKTDKHVYFRISEWKSLQQLVNVIKDNVIYNENGIVAINKPYGVGLAPPKDMSKAARRMISGLDTAAVGSSYYLTQVLPHLAKSLGYSDLTVEEVPERYTSGVTILSTNSTVSEKVQECMLKAKRRDEFFESYWAVVLGTPCPESGFFRYALQYKIIPGSVYGNKRKLPEEMLKQLLLQPGQESVIPCHVHLRKIILPRYFGRNKDLVLEAQLPESFQWSCNALGLSLPTEKSEECVQIFCNS